MYLSEKFNTWYISKIRPPTIRQIWYLAYLWHIICNVCVKSDSTYINYHFLRPDTHLNHPPQAWALDLLKKLINLETSMPRKYSLLWRNTKLTIFVGGLRRSAPFKSAEQKEISLKVNIWSIISVAIRSPHG